LAQVVSAIAVLVGLGFAVTEVKRYRERQSRESALMLVHSFQTPEFAQALMLMVDLAEGLSRQELRERLGPDMKFVALLMTTWESLGILINRGEIDIRLVDDFFGGPILVSWQKLNGLVLELRARDNRETYFEWFQWLAERMLEREDRMPRVPAYIEHKNWRERKVVARGGHGA
jgi:hypothetical protein